MLRCCSALLIACSFALCGCDEPVQVLRTAMPEVIERIDERDFELEICRSRIAEVEQLEALPGTPKYDEERAEILGRAVGEPAVFVQPPPPSTSPSKTRGHPRLRLRRLIRQHRHDKPALRAMLLRDGYAYDEDPHEAFALIRELTLPKLFDEPEIWQQRGERVYRLVRKRARYERGFEYRYAEGDYADRTAKLLFADRVAATQAGLADPLHRDVRALRFRVGFDRIRIKRRTAGALLADLRFGGRWIGALVTSEGARLELGCLDAERDVREQALTFANDDAPRRRAVAALRETVGAVVAERLPFDRPLGAEDHFSDGRLRTLWWRAYLRGRQFFSYEGDGYPVFDRQGRPHPPQMCVEFVLDSFERASGTWYRPLGKPPKRVAGRLDFNEHGIIYRNGVLAFEKFAASKRSLFEWSRFARTERIPFRDRTRFFSFLVEHADRFRAGDVVAIQGPKRDGYVHQHAILIEDVDPVTGMPYALADQMKRPRRRSWEGIMAEAPLRSLLYHVRPKDVLLLKLDPEQERAEAKPAKHASSG